MTPFLNKVSCKRCRGPIITESFKKTEYKEETWGYTKVCVWVCFSCGENHTEEEISRITNPKQSPTT